MIQPEETTILTVSDEIVEFKTLNSEPYDLVMNSLEGDSTILKISDLDCKPINFYKDGLRYFFTCLDNENQKTIWEIETELGRAMQLDLIENDLEDFEKLKIKH